MCQWKAAVRDTLIEVAGTAGTITYRDLAAWAGVPPPHGIHKLTLHLEAMVRADHAAGRPLLAAVAVSRAQGGIPGAGFFQLLHALGRYAGAERGPEASAAHDAELRAAWAHWGRRGGP